MVVARRLAHISMNYLNDLVSKNLVEGLPKNNYVKDRICVACQYGKHIKSSFKTKKCVSTSRPLELIHMDLFGSTQQVSIGEKRYVFVLVDDFSIFTWVLFLTNKSDAFNYFQKLVKKIQNEHNLKIVKLRSDNGTEFLNENFNDFCDELGIIQNYSAAKSSYQIFLSYI